MARRPRFSSFWRGNQPFRPNPGAKNRAHAIMMVTPRAARFCYLRPGDTMAYVIAEPCIGTKDTACIDACPVDCIHPKKDAPNFAEHNMIYIDPVECIDRKSV